MNRNVSLGSWAPARGRPLSCFAVLCGLLAMTCMVTPVAAQSLITFESLQEQLTEQAERIAELEEGP